MAVKGMSEFRADGENYTINDPNIANEFSSSTAYSAGTYVNYQGDLYVFTADHAAGAWTGTDASKVLLGENVAHLKSAFIKHFDKKSYNIVYFPAWEKGAINGTTGEDADGNNNARTGAYLEVLQSTVYTVSWVGSGFAFYVYYYSSDSSSGYLDSSTIYASGRQFTTPANTAYIRIAFYKSGVTSLDDLVPDKLQIVQGATEKTYVSGECLDPDYISSESIPANRLVPGTIKNANLEDASIFGAKIKDQAITTDKINDNAVSILKTSFYQIDGNLYDGTFSFGSMDVNGHVVPATKSNAVSTLIDLFGESAVYTLVSTVGTGVTKYIYWYAADGTYLNNVYTDVRQTTTLSLVAPSGARYMRIRTYKEGETDLANLTPTGISIISRGLPTPETTGTQVLRKAYYTNNFANQSPADATIKAIGHKGLCAEAPENTAAAFIAARKKGFRYIETDVRKTSDGHYVLIHDITVNRTTNGTGNVADKTLAQLQALDAGSWFGSAFAGEKILSLEEACVLFRKLNLIPYLELKYKPTDVAEATAMNDIVKKSGIKYIWLGDAPDYVLFKQADPKMSFCFLASAEPSEEAYGIITEELNSGMDVMLTLDKNALTVEFAEQCAMDGLRLETYTINDVDEMKTITSTYAIKGITSDGFHVDEILQKYEF